MRRPASFVARPISSLWSSQAPALALALFSLGGCGKHPLPEHTSEPRSHTYVFGHRVGFGYGGDSDRFRRYGWAKTEKDSTRTAPRGAALHFNVVDTDQPLTLRLKLSRVDEVDSPAIQPVDVAVNGQKIAHWEVSRRGYYSCVIPAELVKVDPVIGPAAFVLVDLHTPMSGPVAPGESTDAANLHGLRVWELFMVEGAAGDQNGSRVLQTHDGSSYAYGDAVSFGIGGAGERYNLGGWDISEGIFTWNMQTPATLGFRVPPPRGLLSLKMRAAVVTSGPRLQEQPVDVLVNGHKIAEWTIQEPLQWFTAEVPPDRLQEAGTLRIALVLPPSARDAAARIPQELRPRGVQLHDLLISDGG